ncbi:MAG: hypothetical protein LCH95_21485 [Proteobacteria bacterium]|nr:hypothetical protein [Pseudomonadota bacterium]
MTRIDLALVAGLAVAFAIAVVLLDAARPVAGSASAPRLERSAATTASAGPDALSSRPAPVPLHLKPRPAFGSVTIEALIAAAASEEPGGPLPEIVEPTDPDAQAARAAAEADGYRGVRVLRRGPDGSWRASGLRGRTTVMLTVDASGSVSAD